MVIFYLDFVYIGESVFFGMCQVLEKKIGIGYMKFWVKISKIYLGNVIICRFKYQIDKGVVVYCQDLESFVENKGEIQVILLNLILE